MLFKLTLLMDFSSFSLPDVTQAAGTAGTSSLAVPLRLPRETLAARRSGLPAAPRRAPADVQGLCGVRRSPRRAGGVCSLPSASAAAPRPERNGGRVLPLGLPQGSPTSADAVSLRRRPGRPAKDLRGNGSAWSGMAVPAPRPPRARAQRTWGGVSRAAAALRSCLPFPLPAALISAPDSCPGSFAAAESAGAEAGGVRGLPRTSVRRGGEMLLP